MKRLFDLLAALGGLIFFSPVFALTALAIKMESRGPVFYRGERLGKDGKNFRIFKFRTMGVDASQRGGGLTHKDDPRVTRIGGFLRRIKMDELPQLINVVKGEMSLVGPRPEDPRYLQYYTPRQRRVLSVPPGITSIASIRYRHEDEMLSPDDWEKAYVETILPSKLDIELNYLSSRSFGRDLLILAATLFALIRDKARFDALVNLARRAEAWLERYVSWVAVDVPLIVAAYVLAILVRSINTTLAFPEAFAVALGGVLVYLVVNYLFGIYHRFWRYASAQESVALFSSVLVATAVLTVLDLLMHERDLPLGAVWLGGFFTFFFLATVRYRKRIFSGARQMVEDFFDFLSGSGARVLIVGGGDEGQLIAWQIQNRFQGRAYQVVGFVDDDRQKHGLRIHSVRVYGARQQIPELAARLHVDLILLAIPLVKVKEPRELLRLCRQTQAQVKVLPGLFDWLKTNGHTPDWVDLTDEELMQRTVYQADNAAGRALLEGRVVMVTGAAGSIGSELCRQIADYRPHTLVFVDINESGLHDLNVELQTQFPDLHTMLMLCDITDRARLENAFKKARPQIVFHAAAYKHVPILEEHPQEAIRVNLSGTRLLYSMASAFGVERFILISSDKAVNPVNVLGMTKWLGELIVAEGKRDGRTLSAAVRFGNVLGSRGSVVTTFEKQIELGGPLTITHPEMTRYFMSVDEAVSLIIQAAAMTRGGELYVLDMGVAVSILDLAHRMIRARGLRPGKDIAIELIGPRLGEKMNEELIAQGEEKLSTEHPSIFRICRMAPLDSDLFRQQLDQLLWLVGKDISSDEIKAWLKNCVRLLQTPLLSSAEIMQTEERIANA